MWQLWSGSCEEGTSFEEKNENEDKTALKKYAAAPEEAKPQESSRTDEKVDKYDL